MAEQLAGTITHFYPKISVAILKLKYKLAEGDTIHITGKRTDFKQLVESMQINMIPVREAYPGNEIGLKVAHIVHAGDNVYKIL